MWPDKLPPVTSFSVCSIVGNVGDRCQKAVHWSSIALLEHCWTCDLSFKANDKNWCNRTRDVNVFIPSITCNFLWSHKILYTTLLTYAVVLPQTCKHTVMCRICGVYLTSELVKPYFNLNFGSRLVLRLKRKLRMLLIRRYCVCVCEGHFSLRKRSMVLDQCQ